MAPQTHFRVVSRLDREAFPSGVQTFGQAAENPGENRLLQALTRQAIQ